LGVEFAEAAVAVGVVGFGDAVVEFGALDAGALGAVVDGFAGFEGLAWEGDFFTFGGEDDVLDGVFVGGVGEGSGLEVDGGGAVGVGDGVGLARFESSFEQAEGDEVIVGLDGGAVLGELEGDGDGVGAFGACGEFLLAVVVVAEEGVFDGGGLAVEAGGHDVSAEGVHGGSLKS